MSVYPPREDTYFLLEHLEELDFDGKQAIEIGCGNGLVTVKMAEKGAEVTAVDINEEAVEETGKKVKEEGVDGRVTVLESDLFDSVEEKFDLIVFNPPYLPGEETEGDEKWRGGEKGIELTERFLHAASNYLNEGGEILFIASSRSKIEELEKTFDIEVVESRELWFETLYLCRR